MKIKVELNTMKDLLEFVNTYGSIEVETDYSIEAACCFPILFISIKNRS